MSPSIQTLLQQWTGQSQLEQVGLETLQEMAKDYPFSPSVQLLLVKKYQQTNDPLLEQQLKKTTPFFPSAIQLHHWVNESNEMVAEMAPKKLTEVLSEQMAQFQAPIETEKLDYEEEASLQKDYFAAQGIEIDLASLPQDKFTKQLRSFTAWLKVLKQVDLVENTAQIAPEQEKIITAIAEKANKAEDIITESMAEIWAKQGNKRKAIDTYSKLSFIFPEKSVYFASRIEQLKQKK